MKKLFCFLLLGFLCASLFSQTVNDIPLSDIKAEYVEIVGIGKLLSNKISIKIDFGQEVKVLKSSKATLLKDENGELMELNSMIDALNFMTANGYEFVQAYGYVVPGGQNVIHYLLKRKG